MEKPRVRAPAFTDKEDEALIKAYSRNRNLIRGRNSMGVSQRTRNEAWDAVARAVNDADGRCERTVKSVKIHYGNMLAEYKAFKSNDRTSRNSHQNPQPFFKFFDELFGEKSAEGSGAVFDVSGEDYSVDGCSDEFAGPNGQNNFLAALCGGDSAARYANGGTAFSALMNSVQAVVENDAGGGENFLQVANYLSTLPGGGHLNLKTESELQHGASDSERTSAATSRAANTPPAVYLQNNSGNGSTPNINALLSGGLINGVGGGPANGKSTASSRQLLAKRRRSNNVSVVENAETADEIANNKADDAVDHESVTCQQRINALRIKILEKELSVLEWKEETLRKKSRFFDLKIANQLRTARCEMPAGVSVSVSNSLDTTAAFEKSMIVVKNDIDEQETGLPPPRKVTHIESETNDKDAGSPTAEEGSTGDGNNDQPSIFLDTTANGGFAVDSDYSMLNGGDLTVFNSQTSVL